MNTLLQLDAARWPGGPAICPAANLPAFETKALMKDFYAVNGPSCKILREFKCRKCGHWHMTTLAPDPAGASSGTGRSSKWSDDIEPEYE